MERIFPRRSRRIGSRSAGWHGDRRRPAIRPRRRVRITVAGTVAALLFAASAVPAGAQDGGDGDSSNPSATSTTIESSTTSETGSSTASTAVSTTSATTGSTAVPTTGSAPTSAGDGVSSTSTVSTTSGEELPAADDAGANSSTTSTLPVEPSPEDDPLINEAPVDESPDPNASVPPPDRGYRGQEELRPPAVLWGNVKTAEERLQAAINDQVTAIAQARSFRLRSKHLGDALERTGVQSGVTVAEIDAATGRLEARAVTGFVVSSSGNIPDGELSPDLSMYHELLDRQRKHRYLDAALTVDRQSIGELNELKARLGSETLALYERGRFVETSLRRAEEQARDTSGAVEQAVIELEAFRAGSEIYVHGVTFPIAGRYSVPLIDSFGFPRMPGTTDAHWHEGIDIFASRGTPLVATERGVVSRIGNGRLGGLKLWLRGESGADWYYAHLDGFAPGLRNGQVVEAGELLGYVGNTGNAVGTPPHLHMQVHPNGGRPVNPYPLLKIVSDMDLAAMANGSYPGYRYEPRLSSRSQPVAEPATTTTPAPISSTGSTGSDPEQANDSPITPNTVAAEIRSRAVD